MKAAIAVLATAIALSLHVASFGQSPLVADTFIDAVETMKHSVAPLVCVAVKGSESKFLDRKGTAFFISSTGEFLTAAHVIEDMQKSEPPCPVWAVTLPLEQWQPGALDESLFWFSFNIAGCAIDRELDVAACRLTDDLSIEKGLKFKIVPVKLDLNIPSDGTQVAFTGFPMAARDPMTFRANVAAFRPVWRNQKAVAELVLDRDGWPGTSGAPVFLTDGRVFGILIAGATGEGNSLAILRPILSVKKLLADRK